MSEQGNVLLFLRLKGGLLLKIKHSHIHLYFIATKYL